MTLRFIICLSGLLFMLLPAPVWAQVQYTISGYVRAANTGEALPGATVAAPSLGLGATTDDKGYYVLTLPSGPQQVVASFIGYQNQPQTITLTRNQRTNFNLAEATNTLGEVVVQGSGTLEQKLQTTQMSLERLTTREAKLLPALFGEVDLLKTLQLKPGVQNGGEGTSGLFVRGGSADQNLFLVDDAVVYNPSHLFGLFSVFNPDAVQSVDLYKGGFPAQYGGRYRRWSM
ncbi:carboxypeptidase-like regulatory domain-containing protein [Hymenobacter sp. AT01-02]|uniref:carboxypeptidase-like regulatory domain-containing protein n=1 Tax=Hymenobacter sp. AT01-02 TaxID=1571877 RepID=UPI000ACD6EFF|nr:carboxypeptidase-like regulatory domain-containing protein [Hymenobacter sp. AT01-02]